MMLNYKKNPILFLCAILVGLGFAVSLLFWLLTDHWRRRVKPPVVGHGNHHIVLASDQELSIFDATGKRLISAPTQALGIGRPRAIHALDGDKVLISHGDDVLECDLPNRTCRTLIQDATQGRGRSAGRVTLQQREGVVYVAESRQQQIGVYREGRQAGAIDGGTQKLRYPGRILLDKDGHLVVADAGSDRISAFRTGKETLGQLAWSFPIQTDLLEGESFVPIELEAGADGAWWVVLKEVDQAGSFSTKLWNQLLNQTRAMGALVIFDAHGKAIKRVALPNGMMPAYLIPMSQDMLAVDFDRVQFVPISHDGKVLADFHAPELMEQLGDFQHEITRYQRLHRTSFGGMILAIFLFSILDILAGRRGDQQLEPEAGEPQPPAGAKVFRYHYRFYDHWLALWVVLVLLAFWCITVTVILDDGGSLGFVVMLNLAVDFFFISLTAVLWAVDRRLNAIRVTVTKEGVRYQNHQGSLEIAFTAIQEVTFAKYFIPGWITMISPSQTISFSTGYGMDGDILFELKTALEQNNLTGRFDEGKLLGLCKQARGGDPRKKTLNPIYTWSLALNSLFALSGFAFIPGNGILLLWCFGVMLLPSFVFVWIELWRRDKLRKQVIQNDSPAKAPATFRQDLKLVVVISTLTYLAAVAAVLFI